MRYKLTILTALMLAIFGGMALVQGVDAQTSTVHNFTIKVTQDGELLAEGTRVKVATESCRSSTVGVNADSKVTFSVSIECAPIGSDLTLSLPDRHVIGHETVSVGMPSGEDHADFTSRMVTVSITHDMLKHPEWEGQTYITLCSTRLVNGMWGNCAHTAENAAFPTSFEVAYDRMDDGMIVGFSRYENDDKRHWFPSDAGTWRVSITKVSTTLSVERAVQANGVIVTTVEMVGYSANIDRPSGD